MNDGKSTFDGKSPQGWTLDTLKEYLHTLIVQNDKRYEERFNSATIAVNAALAAAEKAVTKAEAASEKRFEGVNEFRQSLADKDKLQMPRAEAAVLMEGMNSQLKTINSRLDKAEGRGIGIGQTFGYIVGAIGILSAILATINNLK